jgi:beta-xylosidase
MNDVAGKISGRARFVAIGAVVAVMALVGAFAVDTIPGRPAAAASTPVVSPTAEPVVDLDAPDPDVIRVGSTYYAYTTGTTWGNHLGILTSDAPDSGWRTLSGSAYGSSALPSPPSWQHVNTQTSPGVIEWGGRWLLYYDGQDVTSGKFCLSVAVASSPRGPFVDTSSAPWICQLEYGGAIDPHPFVDADGAAWLVWKSNDGTSGQPARIWSAKLSADGMSFTTTPGVIYVQDTTVTPWETTVENPQLVLVDATYELFFSAG